MVFSTTITIRLSCSIAIPKIPLYHKSKLVVAVEKFPVSKYTKTYIRWRSSMLGGTVALKTTQPERTAFAGVDTEGKAAPIICL